MSTKVYCIAASAALIMACEPPPPVSPVSPFLLYVPRCAIANSIAPDSPAPMLSELEQTIDRRLDDPYVRTIASAYGFVYLDTDPGSWSSTDAGITLAADTKGRIQSVVLHGRDEDIFRFGGELPHGLKFEMHQEDVEAILGMPDDDCDPGTTCRYLEQGIDVTYSESACVQRIALTTLVPVDTALIQDERVALERRNGVTGLAIDLEYAISVGAEPVDLHVQLVQEDGSEVTLQAPRPKYETADPDLPSGDGAEPVEMSARILEAHHVAGEVGTRTLSAFVPLAEVPLGTGDHALTLRLALAEPSAPELNPVEEAAEAEAPPAAPDPREPEEPEGPEGPEGPEEPEEPEETAPVLPAFRIIALTDGATTHTIAIPESFDMAIGVSSVEIIDGSFDKDSPPDVRWELRLGPTTVYQSTTVLDRLQASWTQTSQQLKLFEGDSLSLVIVEVDGAASEQPASEQTDVLYQADVDIRALAAESVVSLPPSGPIQSMKVISVALSDAQE